MSCLVVSSCVMRCDVEVDCVALYDTVCFHVAVCCVIVCVVVLCFVMY